MAGSTMLIATMMANALWAGLLLRLRPDQFLPASPRPRTLQTAWAIFVIPLMLVSGLLLHLWGVQTVMLLGGTLSALAFLAFERASSKTWTFAAVLLLAGAAAASLVANSVLMAQAFCSGNPVRAANIGFLLIIAGTLLGKPVVNFLLAKLQIRTALLVLAMASLVPAAFVAVTPGADFAEPVGTLKELADPRLALIALMVFLCYPMEAAIIPWARRYASELGTNRGSVAFFALGFWIAFLGSRLLAGLWFPASREAFWLMLLAALAAATAGNTLSAYGRWSSRIGLWLVGACCAPLIPTLIGMLLRDFPAAEGPAFGTVFAAGMLGNLLFLPWIKAPAADQPTQTVLRRITIVAALTLPLALVLVILN